MIYEAALVDAQMTKDDFLKVIGHNPQFHGVCFKGKVELAEASVADGKMRRFVWRLRDERETSNDLTFVVMFNLTRDQKSLEEHQFILARRSEEIQTLLDDLCEHLETDDVEYNVAENGNLVYFLRNCNMEWFSKQFTNHARAALKGV